MAPSPISSSPRPLSGVDAQYSASFHAGCLSTPPPFRRSVNTESRAVPALHVDGGRLTTRAAAWNFLNLCCENALQAWALHPPGRMAAYTEVFDRPVHGLNMSRMAGVMKGETGIFFNPNAIRPYARLIGSPTSFEFVLNGHVVGPNSSEADIRLAQQIAAMFCFMA